MQPAKLVAAIRSAGVPIPSVVGRAEQAQFPHDDDRVLQVYWSETDHFGDPLSDGAPQFVSVTIHHVPVARLPAIRRALSEQGVPSLIDWLRDADCAPEGWRATGPHGRTWRWTDERLIAADV